MDRFYNKPGNLPAGLVETRTSRAGPTDSSSGTRTQHTFIMRIEELIVGILLIVAVASYGTLAAVTLLT